MFDMTFPFHFDNSWNDGGHYGRLSCRNNSHCNLVDVMQINVLLNGLCPAQTRALHPTVSGLGC